MRSGGWGCACFQEQPFRSPFRLPYSDFHSSSALNYLYVCNYLFLTTCDGGVFSADNMPWGGAFSADNMPLGRCVFSGENSPNPQGFCGKLPAVAATRRPRSNLWGAWRFRRRFGPPGLILFRKTGVSELFQETALCRQDRGRRGVNDQHPLGRGVVQRRPADLDLVQFPEDL